MFLTSLPIPAHVAESILKTERSCRISKNQLRNARGEKQRETDKGDRAQPVNLAADAAESQAPQVILRQA